MDQAVSKIDRRIPAIAVSRGIGIGPIVFFSGGEGPLPRTHVNDSEPEIQRLERAAELTRLELSSARNNDGGDILDVQLLILERSPILSEISKEIRDQKINAEWAVRTISDRHRERQMSVAEPQFREKALDIDDLAYKLLSNLRTASPVASGRFLEAVVTARELRPSTMIAIGAERPAAIVAEHAGWTSHASILAREMGIPMISGISSELYGLKEGELGIVDAVHGELILDPSLQTIERYRTRSFERDTRPPDRRIAGGNVVTRDGVEILIRANVDGSDAYRAAHRAGASGIGLFRSESLIRPPGIIPSEEEQETAYRKLAVAAEDDGVAIRTFDIGVDWQRGEHYPERNPALGLRSIRLSLEREGAFRAQIRALLKASWEQNVSIILPMISGLDEVQTCKDIISEETLQLQEKGIACGEPRLGAMIEVPSAVFTAGDIAAEVDFLCIGTNDLVQYLLAVDRDNDSIAALYKTLHPAVLIAIRNVIEVGRSANIPTVICGEMAGSPFYVPALIGLGATELSMNANSIRPVRHLLAGISADECRTLLDQAFLLKSADRIESLLHHHYSTYWEDLFPPGLLNLRHL